MKQNPFQTPIKIWYDILPGLPKVKWPILKVKLKHDERNLPQPLIALVDSGANKSILHPFVAEALGFNLEKLGRPEKGVSASGKYKSWKLPELDIDIYGYKFKGYFELRFRSDIN